MLLSLILQFYAYYKYHINSGYVSPQNDLQAEVDFLRKLITEEREKLLGKQGVLADVPLLTLCDKLKRFIKIFPIRVSG